MRRISLLAAGSLLALAATSPALAQDQNTAAAGSPKTDAQPEPSTAPAAPQSDDHDVIVVTAQLREQRPIEVPYALTAYTGRFLDDLGVQEFEDLARYTPGFSVQNQSPNNPAINIRGITTDSGESFFEPRVSIYQDGVSISKPRGAYVELFDIERVEVSKGPQSTLYGRGALIGAVNIVQGKPQLDDVFGMGRVAFGNLGYRMFEGMVNAPLGDDVGVRVAGRLKKRDGYVENLLGGDDFQSVDTGAIRGSFRFAPSDAFTLDVIGNYQKDEPTGTAFKSIRFSPTDPVTGAVLDGTGIRDGVALTAGDGFEGGTDLGLDRHVEGVSGLIKAKLSDSLTLNSITAYRRFEALEILDADGISLPLVTVADDVEGKQFSQELRVTWNDGGPVTAFLGASYFNESGSQRTPAQFDERVTLAQLAGALNGMIPGRPATDPAPMSLIGNTGFTSLLLQGVAAASGYALPASGTCNGLTVAANCIAANLKPIHREEQTNFSETKAIDIFGDVTTKIGDKIELGAGVRYTRDDKTTGVEAEISNGRSILGGFIGALSQSEPTRTALLAALGAPGAANIPTSLAYPVPVFGLTFQATPLAEEELSDDGFTWRLFGRYEPNPDSSLYAIYARGRRPDVLTALPPALPGAPARFILSDAETVDSYEIGAKTALLGRSLYFDAAAFYYKYKNFQTTEQVGTTFVTTNAGEAESYGLEAQVRYNPSRAIRLFANYAYNHARFTTGLRDGNRFRLSPDHTFSAGATLAADVGPGRIDFTPSVTYQSKVFFDDDNDRPDLQTIARGKIVPDLFRDEFQNGFALVSARLGYTYRGFRAEAFVENALDKAYIKDAGNTGDALGLATFVPGEPRTYGIQLTGRF